MMIVYNSKHHVVHLLVLLLYIIFFNMLVRVSSQASASHMKDTTLVLIDILINMLLCHRPCSLFNKAFCSIYLLNSKVESANHVTDY